MAAVNQKTRGLNSTQPGQAPTFAADYAPKRQSPAQSQSTRLQICEQMLKDRHRFLDRRGWFVLRDWIAEYSLFGHHRNDTALSAIGIIPEKTLKHWYQHIAKDDEAMAALRASIQSHQVHERKTRKRHSRNRQKWGETPFAERLFCHLRDLGVSENADHGVAWGMRTMNRILEVPWIFQVALEFIDDVEATKWKERGTVVKQHIDKLRVRIVCN